MSIADALKTEGMQGDPVYRAARQIAESDLPEAVRVELVKAISTAREKNPCKPATPGSMDAYDTGAGPLAAVAAKVANSMKKTAK